MVCFSGFLFQQLLWGAPAVCPAQFPLPLRPSGPFLAWCSRCAPHSEGGPRPAILEGLFLSVPLPHILAKERSLGKLVLPVVISAPSPLSKPHRKGRVRNVLPVPSGKAANVALRPLFQPPFRKLPDSRRPRRSSGSGMAAPRSGARASAWRSGMFAPRCSGYI